MKKFITICILFVLSLSVFALTGCGTNYTPDDINSMYREVLTYVGDAQGFLQVGVNKEKVVQASSLQNDKAYIFPLCYDNFLSAEAGLFFGVASRQEKDITYTLRKFNKDELNKTYEKLKDVRDASMSVASNRSIYESSKGNLKYQELVVSCNNLIEKLNALNDYFSPIYFEHYFTGYTAGELSDGELKDALFYDLQVLSEVAYDYALKHFEFSNPYGEVKTWYDNSTMLKETNERILETLGKLRKNSLTEGMMSGTKNNIISILERIQLEKTGYKDEFLGYQKALNSVDIVMYSKATNKSAYKQNLDKKEQSCFEIIDRFLNGRYNGMCLALRDIVHNYL